MAEQKVPARAHQGADDADVKRAGADGEKQFKGLAEDARKGNSDNARRTKGRMR